MFHREDSYCAHILIHLTIAPRCLTALESLKLHSAELKPTVSSLNSQDCSQSRCFGLLIRISCFQLATSSIFPSRAECSPSPLDQNSCGNSLHALNSIVHAPTDSLQHQQVLLIQTLKLVHANSVTQDLLDLFIQLIFNALTQS